MARMTGVVYITLNGQKKRSEGDASLKVGGKIREQIKDANGPCGLATKEVIGGEVKFSLRHAINPAVKYRTESSCRVADFFMPEVRPDSGRLLLQ
ncbi:phage tail tube protein [Chromobacterium sp. ATCC 53434]|uniref:phage tail tube protein n=1 Tax=Chromobacterium sp. (strain ATCC 53434 / SC 14030) TaxID=2059672 RepID=UPI001305072C|nr:phage tail tube protein [Chromobacterium sp. ATCC 53434]